LLPEGDGGIVVSISVEICSATFQVGNDISLIVSNALFGDGAAAAVVSRRAEGWRLVRSASMTRPLHREAIRYIHKGGELHNQLAREVPELAAAIVPEVVADLLASCRVPRHEVNLWALHPGGDKVLNALQESLDLTDTQMAPSRLVLRNFGNMSSPTAWFIVRDVAGQAGPDEYCLMVAFGAGFSAHACLLQRCARVDFRVKTG
jgi:predicted naringenin-chalcone synthase